MIPISLTKPIVSGIIQARLQSCNPCTLEAKMLRDKARRMLCVAVGVVFGLHIAQGDYNSLLFWITALALAFLAIGLTMESVSKE